MKAKIPTASELMYTKVHAVTPDLPLIELVEFLLRHKTTCAPVVEKKDGSNRLLGFISEQDALEHLSNEMFYGFPEPDKTVQMCMKKHPISVTPDVNVFAISSLLVNHGFHHLPVVDDKHCLLGIVRRSDVLRTLKTFHTVTIKEHDAEYSPPDITKIMNHRFIVSN